MTRTCMRATTLSHLLPWLAAGLLACQGQSDPADAGCDSDGSCRDSDCDTICDIEEGYPDQDTDGDGEPDYLDLDSDNDGLSDREEAGDGKRSTPPVDRNENGIPDAYEEDYPLRAWKDTNADPDASQPMQRDAMVEDAGPTHMKDAGDIYTPDSGEVDVDLCPAEAQVPNACMAKETDFCDGLDDDCDGQVDGPATCVCQRGEVRSCFTGPPGRRGVGACADGYQVCQGVEFTSWGPCIGGTAPSTEVCDGIDNDCNGCTDELVECTGKLTCPEPGDPRIPVAKPFMDYTLDASEFYSGDDVLGYRWRVRGSPCDTLFQTGDGSATSTSGKLSYRLWNQAQAQAGVRFALSGNYGVELEITTEDGTLGCEWVMPVRGPGVRVELCWPETGPVAASQGQKVDLDLHVARQGSTNNWGQPKDCFHQTCAGASSPWGFSQSPLANCQGSRNTAVYEVLGHCPNPRLDADNRLDGASSAAYVTENINFDNPAPGDRLRVMVQYNDNSPNDVQGHPSPAVTLASQPLLNIYCGGALKATYGGDPTVVADDPNAVSGLDTPGQRWHVADVVVGGGGANTGCSVTPLSAPAPATGYWLDDGSANNIAW